MLDLTDSVKIIIEIKTAIWAVVLTYSNNGNPSFPQLVELINYIFIFIQKCSTRSLMHLTQMTNNWLIIFTAPVNCLTRLNAA